MRALLALVLLCVLAGAAAASSWEQTLSDRAGDVHRWDHARTPPQDLGAVPEGALDVVRAAVAERGEEAVVELELAADPEAAPERPTTYAVQLATGREAGLLVVSLLRTGATERASGHVQEAGATTATLTVAFAQEGRLLRWSFPKAEVPTDLPCLALFQALTLRPLNANGSQSLHDTAPDAPGQVCGLVPEVDAQTPAATRADTPGAGVALLLAVAAGTALKTRRRDGAP